jgi:hypothetical protein
MKTVERENRNRWAAMLSIRADGTAGQNRPCSSTWGWKQEKLQQWEKYFLDFYLYSLGHPCGVVV